MAYVGKSPLTGAYQVLDNIESGFNASAVAFNLTVGGTAVLPGNEASCIISISGVAQPTDEQLNAVDTAADLEERQNAVRATRRNAYGDLGSQLDMQYHDNVDGTTTWKDHVASVKTANPIPTE